MPVIVELLLQYKFHRANLIGRSWKNEPDNTHTRLILPPKHRCPTKRRDHVKASILYVGFDLVRRIKASIYTITQFGPVLGILVFL